MRNLLFALIASICIVGCDSKSGNQDLFGEGRAVGINKNHDLEETSGLVASARYPGLFWAHNDSGHPPVLFLLDSTGKTVRSFRLDGVKNRDWEDIAIGPGPDSLSTLFIGDIGDNRQNKDLRYIYYLREPNLDAPQEIPVDGTLFVHLSDKPRDAEALLMDPRSRNLYIITKMEREIRLYEVSYPYQKDTLEIGPVAKLPMRYITAGDVSTDGSEILLKNYGHVYYWKRQTGESIAEVLSREPTELAYKREPQGESIAWARDGSGYYTLSENGKGERGRLLFYARNKQDSLSGH